MSAKRVFSAVALLSFGLGFGLITEACDSSGGGGDGDGDGDDEPTPQEVAKAYCEALCPCVGSDDDDDDGEDQDGVSISGGGSACEDAFISDCEESVEDVFQAANACLDDAYVTYLACAADKGECTYCDNGPCLEDSGCTQGLLDDFDKCSSGEGGGGGGGPIPVGVGATTGSVQSTSSPASSGASPSTTSGGEGGSGPGDCAYTNDGECDEPDLCPPGTDTADCTVPPTPCGAECFQDPGCDEAPPDPSSACTSCVENEVEQGADSACVLEASFGDDCTGDCADFVSCQLSASIDECAGMYPDGYAQLESLIYRDCGSCGDGSF